MENMKKKRQTKPSGNKKIISHGGGGIRTVYKDTVKNTTNLPITLGNKGGF